MSVHLCPVQNAFAAVAAAMTIRPGVFAQTQTVAAKIVDEKIGKGSAARSRRPQILPRVLPNGPGWKSTNLNNGLSPFPFVHRETSNNAEGAIEFQFTVPDDATFFRVEAKQERTCTGDSMESRGVTATARRGIGPPSARTATSFCFAPLQPQTTSANQVAHCHEILHPLF
jgi:hypothetical protein